MLIRRAFFVYKIKTFNNIDEEGLARLPESFEIVDGEDYDGIILRSYNLSMDEISKKTSAIARAGAGVNNIPVDECSNKGIVVFNTPGANANAVKELVVLGALLASRKVFEGIKWAQGLEKNESVAQEVESEKSRFTGPEILGKKVGVIGLGAIGLLVANTFVDMGCEVFGFDPFISVEHAWGLTSDVTRINSVDWLFENCDYITVHIPYMDSTHEFVNAGLLGKAKDGIRIINFARGELVETEAIISAVQSGKVACYITDFPNESFIGVDNIIAVPHLGASTPEAETNCAIMAVEEISDYLMNGNIRNSVNYPDCELGERGNKIRLAINHRNIPNMVGQITSLLASEHVNIDNMINRSRGDYAYTIVDVDNSFSDVVMDEIMGIDGILNVRRFV